MKWFKHMSDLPRDEGVARYLDEAGKDWLVAYGFLMLLLEAIASRMESNVGHLVCTATYSISQWERLTNCHRNRVRKYLGLCEVIGWVEVEFEGSSCRVTVPRMVQWRDEYTRKSGHTPDKVAQSRKEQTRPDQRERKDEGALPGCQKAKGARLSPPPDFKISDSLQEWATKTYPSVDIHKETAKFKNWEYPTTCTNWDSRWKLWIQRAAEFQQKHNGSSAKPSLKEQLLKFGEELGLERRPQESEDEYCGRVEKANEQRVKDQDL